MNRRNAMKAAAASALGFLLAPLGFLKDAVPKKVPFILKGVSHCVEVYDPIPTGDVTGSDGNRWLTYEYRIKPRGKGDVC